MYNLCIIGLGNPSPKYDNSRHNIGKDWVINVSKKFFKEFKEKSVLFMSVNKAKFRKPIFPNEKVLFEVNFVNSVRDVYKFEGNCYKEDVKVCEAEFSAMITYK